MTYCRLGQTYLEADRLDDAAAAFHRYSELHPADTIGYVGMARVAVGRQEWDQALQHLEASLANGGDQDFYTHYYLARTHAALGQDELARQHSDLAKEPPKGDWLFKYDPLLTSLGSASGSQIPALEAELARLQDSRDWPRLARITAQIIEYRQGSITMMANLAMYYRFMGRHADAHRVLDRAMALRPESPMLQARRAETHLAEQKLEQALASADAALAHEPTGNVAFTAQQARGRALFLMRRYEPAEQALRQAVSLQPQNPAVNFFLGETLQASGKPSEAAQYYRKVLELFPGNRAAKRKLDEVTGTSN
jgi:tetratricopeptide (TPR) repeat protein